MRNLPELVFARSVRETPATWIEPHLTLMRSVAYSDNELARSDCISRRRAFILASRSATPRLARCCPPRSVPVNQPQVQSRAARSMPCQAGDIDVSVEASALRDALYALLDAQHIQRHAESVRVSVLEHDVA